MNLKPDQRLLQYVLTEQIGEGGMGVVWSARDTSLERNVAIKFLPAHLAAEAERLQRFEREAKLLAAIEHPNIAAVYGLHEVDGLRFIAMELVQGEDLSRRMQRGPLALDDAIDVARQIADALEAAHEQGVIHRDLKPANVKLTPEGKVKVLDLGLAKALGGEISGDRPSVSMSPTMTSAGTISGTLLGTAGYMSPEQAKGRTVDRRADIWAFGVVLFEMLSGKSLFEAETISETLAAVLRDEISFDALPERTPQALVKLMRRCLDRDPRTRLRDIGEARIALASASSIDDGQARAIAAPVASGWARMMPWLLVALFGAIAAFALWQSRSRAEHSAEMLTLTAPIPEELLVPSAGQTGVLALSPRGDTLAIVLDSGADEMLYVQRLDRGPLVMLDGTENASSPSFSPDGKWIAFIADDTLKKIPVEGGTPLTLCSMQGDGNRGADWGSDDRIVIAPSFNRPLMSVSASGGELTPLTEIDSASGERTHRWPQSIADKDLVLFTVGTIDSPESYDEARIDAIRPSTGERVTLLERASMARYLPSGQLLFGRDGFLFAVGFDIDTLKSVGTPVPVMQDVMGIRSSGVVHFAVGDNGLLAYIAGKPQSRQARLAWLDRDGSREPLAVEVNGYINPRISPDRSSIATQIEGATTFDIWRIDLVQVTASRLTFDGDNLGPSWSPDGRDIVFASVRDKARPSLYRTPADGSGQPELLLSLEQMGARIGTIFPGGWTPDGGGLLFEYTDDSRGNIAYFDVASGDVRQLLTSAARESDPALSPNGRWLAYSSDESGSAQIFVTDFPEPGGKWQISTAGGFLPRWSPDGTELFYRLDDSLYSAAIDDADGTFKFRRPSVVLDDLRSGLSEYDYDVFDAKRFLIVEEVESDSEPIGVTIVVNWRNELLRLVPPH